MKIRHPQTPLSPEALFNSKWRYALLVVLTALAFLAGMAFYHLGYAEYLTSFIRGTWRPEPPAVVVTSAAEIAQELDNETQLYQSNGLATVFLDIPFDSMLQLEEKRAEALGIGVLHSSDEDFVSARLRYNDEQNLDIKLRLKGDWTDHLEGDKWSFRVHVTENDGAVLGMRRFSLQGPQTRTFMNDWGYHQNLFREGLLATRYHFVNVIINGDYKGVYALEESFSEDLLEAHARREGIIFRFNEDLMWYDWGNFLDTYPETERFWRVDNPSNAAIEPFRGNRVLRSATLTAEAQAAEALLYALQHGQLPASQVLDEELWGRYFAVTDLWGAGHSTRWHNNRYYYNPVTALLEPIAFDGLVFHPSFWRDQLAFPFYGSPFFVSPGVQKAYAETLARLTQPEYLEKLRAEIGPELENYYNRLQTEYADDPNLQLPWEQLEARRAMLARHLNPEQPLRGYYHQVKLDGELYLQVDLFNAMLLPVQLRELVLPNEELTIEKGWCVLESCLSRTIFLPEGELLLESINTSYAVPASFTIPLSRLTAGSPPAGAILSLQANIYGLNHTYSIPLYPNQVPQGMESALPTSPLAEALAAHEFLTPLDERRLGVAPGDWSVNGDLILPPGYELLIPANTILRFGVGNLFVARGAVELRGAENAPVVLTAQGASWGGLVVLNAADTSTLAYVHIEKTAGIEIPGGELTGGATFYESPVEISHVVISDSTSTNALHVIRAPVELSAVEFRDTASNALRGDYINGAVENSSFHDIGGSAFDLAGSHVRVRASYFVNIGAAAISAGEASTITLENPSMHNVNIGIASRDLSLVRVKGGALDAVQTAGLVAYAQVPQYGPATIEASQLEVHNTATPAICQTDSEITLNGETIPTEDINVDAIFEHRNHE